jgi:hypothetical protein
MAQPRKPARTQWDRATWTGVGAGLGMAFGVVLGGGAGVAIGLALGAGVGAALGARRADH